jgi:hypothetical protein
MVSFKKVAENLLDPSCENGSQSIHSFDFAIRRCRTFWKKARENSASRWAAREWIVVS